MGDDFNSAISSDASSKNFLGGIPIFEYWMGQVINIVSRYLTCFTLLLYSLRKRGVFLVNVLDRLFRPLDCANYVNNGVGKLKRPWLWILYSLKYLQFDSWSV
jgi:hypothetical protein